MRVPYPREQLSSSSCLIPGRMVHEPSASTPLGQKWDGCRGVLHVDRNRFRGHGTHAGRAASPQRCATRCGVQRRHRTWFWAIAVRCCANETRRVAGCTWPVRVVVGRACLAAVHMSKHLNFLLPSLPAHRDFLPRDRKTSPPRHPHPSTHTPPNHQILTTTSATATASPSHHSTASSPCAPPSSSASPPSLPPLLARLVCQSPRAPATHLIHC